MQEKGQGQKSVLLAENIFWVGHVIPDDPFQCHVYLIVNGKESILIDPGSVITIETTVSKIEEHIPLQWIKYLICQHQDPDITGSIGWLEKQILRDDLQIVTHSRAVALLKHYQWSSPFYEIEKNDWKLETKTGLSLEFVFTPYLHFPGAFCTYEKKSKIMFSSDLFGGFTDSFSLFAEDMSYFEAMRPFHQHYMPANEILVHGLSAIEKYEMDMIAPQHGSIIPKSLIEPIINELKLLECGYFLEPVYSQDIRQLILKNDILKEIIKAMASNAHFSEVINSVKDIIRRILPVQTIAVYLWGNVGEVYFMSSEGGKRKHKLQGMGVNDFKQMHPFQSVFIEKKNCFEKVASLPGLGVMGDIHAVIVPLITDSGSLTGIGVLCCLEKVSLKMDDDFFLKLFAPIASAAEKEVSLLDAVYARDHYYEMAVSDPLTGLFNRQHLNTIGVGEVQRAKRYAYPISLIMLDIDNFKKVNDTFGHLVGDEVLKSVAQKIKTCTREFDFCVRYGGEEFLILMPHTGLQDAGQLAERIRVEISKVPVVDHPEVGHVTVSMGVSWRVEDESLNSMIQRADQFLYVAKKNGKNRVEGLKD